jgi:hypothetical protein
MAKFTYRRTKTTHNQRSSDSTFEVDLRLILSLIATLLRVVL